MGGVPILYVTPGLSYEREGAGEKNAKRVIEMGTKNNDWDRNKMEQG